MSLTPNQKRSAREIASRRAAKARTVRASSIPPRGTTDAYGDAFAGLPGDRLAVNAVGGTELASGATNAERAVTSEHQRDNSTNSRVLASVDNDNTGRSDDRAVGARHQKDNSTDSRVLSNIEGARAVGQAHIQTNSLTARHFPRENNQDILPTGVNVKAAQVPNLGALNGSIGTGKLDDQAVSIGKLGSAVKGGDNDGGPPQSDKGVRKIFGTGDSKGAAASNHNHSVSFGHLPPATQDAALVLRGKLRTVAGLPGEVGDLARGVLALMHLAFDDYELTAEERRAKEKADPAFKAEKDHERFWHDASGEEGLQPRRRFEKEAHPDLPVA